MANISEHHTKEEWECDYRKHCRVSLFVHWHTICVDDLLERASEFVSPDISRRPYRMIFVSLNLS